MIFQQETLDVRRCLDVIFRAAAFKDSRSPRSDPHSHITADLFTPSLSATSQTETTSASLHVVIHPASSRDESIVCSQMLNITKYTFSGWYITCMHLADAFIQSVLQCIQVIHLLSVHVFPGNRTHNLCAANTMLYHWATGTTSHTWLLILHDYINKNIF